MRRAEGKSSPLVMIADNDEEERCILKAILKLKGFKVVEAADGQEAINLATKATPDLLLIDLRLPRVSGPAVIRQIKNQARLRNLAIVTVSLSASGGQQSRVAGSSAHLEKPVEFDQLTSLIDRLLPEPRLRPAQI
jgi:CheY-like chemotaxis protein